MTQPILIIDFGAQYAHLIANRIRRLGAYSEICQPDITPQEITQKNAAGIILSGGPKSVYADDGLQVHAQILSLGIPVLGICYGHQLLVHALGGKVERGSVHEFGKSTLTPQKTVGILENFPENSTVWMSHVDTVKALPASFEVIGSTPDCATAVIMNEQERLYGVQFHPEVTHSEKGMEILKNFVRICGVENSWQMTDFVGTEIKKIQKQAKGKNVFLLVSGGVDSSVTFALLEKALGKKRVYGLFVDHGLLRKDEATEVKAMLGGAGFSNLHVEDASEKFLTNLSGVTDPEEKRRIIGETFLQVQEEVTKRLNLNPDEWLLGQGTIYPDTIESGGTKHAAKIKTHHNRVEQIEKLIAAGKIIEPVKDLYKDEVREVGRKLGLPEKMVSRHPFPGPGLGVRILCTTGNDALTNASEVETNIVEKFSGLEPTVLPIKSVGVQGDFRSYRHPFALANFLESDGEIDWSRIETLSAAIPNMFPEINRVLLTVQTNDKLESITAHAATLTRERIATLQEADAIIRHILETEEFAGKDTIWQFPVVLCPLSTDHEKESIILRPVESQEAMTASFSKLPWEMVQKMANAILEKLSGRVSTVFYDVTNKPPGTIEWE